jgi:putative component of membrane protein insertase Oxa1/YidC/SpoIIIJ protein YidD
MVKSALLKAIGLYQKTGGSVKHFALSCNFSPTCSHYTYQAIDRFGVIKGSSMGIKRIRRCNDPDCIQVIQDPVPSK